MKHILSYCCVGVVISEMNTDEVVVYCSLSCSSKQLLQLIFGIFISFHFHFINVIPLSKNSFIKMKPQFEMKLPVRLIWVQ